ncbi:MAG: hypothetical protein K2N24_00030 [Lachnospiraceae bacterium]|nr:hypothetical protein [Lachnospiraceae bacterium]
MTGCNRTLEEEDYDYSWYIELWSKQLEPILTGEELEQLEALEWDEKIRPYMEYDWVGDEGLLSIDFSGASSWIFQLADLNQDGQPEMLVALSQYARSLPDFIRVYTIQDGTVIYCGAIDGGWRRLELNCELEYFPSYYVDVYQNSAGEFRYLSCEDFYNYDEYNYYQFYESTFDGTTVSCQPVYAIRYLADEIEGVTDQRYMAGDCTEWDTEKWEAGMDDEMYSAFRQVMKEYMQGYEKVDMDFTLSQYEMPGLAFRLPSEHQESIRNNIVAGFAQALGYMEERTEEGTEKPVIYEFLSTEEIDQAQGLLAGNYQTFVQDVEECKTVDEYEIDGGRILMVGKGYGASYNWKWRVLIDDIGLMYIQHRKSDEVKLYTNAVPKVMPDMVWYLVDEEVRNHAVFNSFIENEISAYDSAVKRDMYMVNYYEEYHYGKNNVFDESWSIYGVHFMAEDLDGDEEEELLVLLQWNASVGDLFVFHEKDGELYAWQEWEHFYDDRLSDIICYDDGMIRMIGALGVEYGHYNSDGILEGMSWRETCEHVDSENEDEMYKYGGVALYKDGMEWGNIVKSLSYEGICFSDEIYGTGEDTSEWTPENQLIKRECDVIVEEWHHSGEGRRISAIQYEDEKGIIMLSDLLRMEAIPEGEEASVYDGEYTLTLGMEFEKFCDYYGEEYIPSVSTPTQLIGTQMIDGKYYDQYFYDYEDVSIITTNYNRKTGDSSIYTICEIDLWDTSRFHTSKGIAIGDTLEELEAAYGKELKLTDEERHDCGYVYTENGIVTRFYIDQDSIVGISIQIR